MSRNNRKNQIISALKAISPNLIINGQLNEGALNKIMGKKSYGLRWEGKESAFEEANTPTSSKLTPLRGEGQDWLIRGDNLEALKALQSDFNGQVDVIIIDPPYNTGKRFTYNDNFKGKEKTKGKHDDWLSMMTPRLILAKRLLANDGCLFIHIGDDEIGNLKLLLESIFGAENMIGILTWIKKKKGSHLSKALRSITEYILVVAKDKTQTNLYGGPAYADKWQPLAKKTNRIKRLSFQANVVETKLPDGVYTPNTENGRLQFDRLLTVENGKITTAFNVDGPFVWTQQKLEAELLLGTRAALSKKFGFNVFRHDQKSKFKRPLSLLNKDCGVGSYEDAFDELKNLLGVERQFTYAKPTSLLRYLIDAGSHFKPNALVMDFFAGSGSLGEAVWQINAESGSNKRFILVQQTSRVENAQFKTIADICEARLTAAQPKYKGADLPTIWFVDDG